MDPNCQSVITEWKVVKSGDKNSAVDTSSTRELMRIDKPHFNHNGGTLAFGPDRMLYISLGDGGNANANANDVGVGVGVGHAPSGNAQSLAPGNVLDKILRINPLARNSVNGKCGVPANNPLVGKTGADEIFAWGLRNLYRMSLDMETGKLWVGDVGQNDIEEIDVVVKGCNYGWPIKEGTFLFDNNGRGVEAYGFIYKNSLGLSTGLIEPVADYDHADGVGQRETRVSIIGVAVYRGDKIKGLRGPYVFADYSGEIGTRDSDDELHLLASSSGTLDLTNGQSAVVVLKLPKVGGGKDDNTDD